MTDIDKFFMTSMFIMNWIKYCGIMIGPSYNNRGPCTDYANLQSLALQLLGVPAIPIQCGMQAAPHAIVWVYLDIGFGKKWYLSDLTFGDSGFEPYNGILASSPWINNKSWILTDIAPSQFVSIDEVTPNGTPAYQHDISNVLYGAPWPDIANSYNKTGIPMIGEVSYGNQDNYVGRRNAGIGLTSNFNYFTSTIGTLEKSRIFYINGKGYYFEKDSNSSHGIRLCEVEVKINGRYNQNVDINLPNELLNKFTFSERDDTCPLVQQYGNKIALFLNPQRNKERSILVLKTNEIGIDWSSYQEFKINLSPELQDLNVYNFDIDIEGNVRIDFANNINVLPKNFITKTFNLGKQFKYNFTFNANNYDRPGDLEISKNYFSALISMFRTGEGRDGYLPMAQRKDFYKFMNDQTLNNVSQSIMNIYNQYFEVIKHVHLSSGESIQSSVLDSLYFISESTFSEYGFKFDNLKLYNNPNDMLGTTEIKAKYSVYYSSNKPNSINDLSLFKEVVHEVLVPSVKLSDLTSNGFSNTNGNGYYYLVIDKNNVKSISNVFELSVGNESYLFDTILAYYSNSNLANKNTKITNYNENVINWSEDGFNLHFEIYCNKNLINIQYEVKNIELKYVNPNNKQVKVVRDKNYFNSNYDSNRLRYFGDIDLGNVDNTNHGIYYIEITAENKSTHEISTTYTNFNFIFTQKDYDDWNKQLWVDTVKVVSMFKEVETNKTL